ncbi:polysaccharide biosynthesis tyrosine autokinase [Sphingomonas sp. BK235]|uniref:GumC family protein n=1 Tax=Sphingomonas sp. BK235 TaxID=2512131 RepID=UPI00105250DF|nr:polysaccharide biosynthesis tyrosine autokinase [Sphingomonas sp. BK235]TCP29368.1 capsular exopolysaccharide synthesis family protein [Sphingomonas sp. BK235]
MSYANDRTGPAVLTAETLPGDAPQRGLLPPLLLQYWSKALRWRWIILAIIAGCLLASLVITLLTPKRYTGEVQVEISREQKQITKVEGLESQEAGRDIEFYATQYALLRTRPLAARVVKDLRLINSPDFFVSQGRGARYDELKDDQNTATLNREAVDLLLRNVAIDPVRTSRLVNVRFTSRSPQLSAAIANQWVKAFIAANIDRQFASTAEARQILEQRIGVLRTRLEQSERQVVTYATSQGIVTLDQVRDETGRSLVGRTLTASDLEALNTALNRATEARILAQSRTGSNANLASELSTNQALALLRQQRAEAAGEYARLLVQFEPDYPQAREAQRRVQSIDAAITREVARVSGGRSEEYREAMRREEELRGRVAQLKQRLDAQQRASIQYAIYQREADTNRQLYDALLQRYKEIGVAGTVAASNIAVVEPAEVPLRPSAPSLLINLTVALLAGVALAAMTVFALDQIDEGIHDPSELKTKLGIPLLGHTPLVRGSIQAELNNTKSAFYEAYFSVRSNLSFATAQGFPRSLMVTSTRPAEGKSSSSLALSLVVGRTDRRVLLIDADMRSPSIHSLVDLPNEVGLSNVLAGQEDWRNVVQPTAFKNVSVISTGPMPPNAAELLSGGQLDRLMAESIAEYDHVILDSPPILGLADAPLLARAVDGCLLVVESKGVAVRAIRSSIERLHMAHGQIFGAVLTKLQYRDGGYGRGYGYGYNYGDERSSRDDA